MAKIRPLFWARINQGVVEYHSCRTGHSYSILPSGDGFTVESPEAHLTIWTSSRKAALCLVEATDLASLARKEEECLPLTG